MKRQMLEDRETINEHIKKISQLHEQLEMLKQENNKEKRLLEEQIQSITENKEKEILQLTAKITEMKAEMQSTENLLNNAKSF